MTYEEIKQAFRDRAPVMYKSIYYGTYECIRINAIILRKNEAGEDVIQAELLEKSGRGVVIASIDQVLPVRRTT